MKGGASIEVLIDLALSTNEENAKQAASVLKSQVFLYEVDMKRLKDAFTSGNSIAEDILKSYSKAEFFTNLPEISEEIQVVTFVAGIGDISTDFLSPGAMHILDQIESFMANLFSNTMLSYKINFFL